MVSALNLARLTGGVLVGPGILVVANTGTHKTEEFALGKSSCSVRQTWRISPSPLEKRRNKNFALSQAQDMMGTC